MENWERERVTGADASRHLSQRSLTSSLVLSGALALPR
jgi:hypothetical protein